MHLVHQVFKKAKPKTSFEIHHLSTLFLSEKGLKKYFFMLISYLLKLVITGPKANFSYGEQFCDCTFNAELQFINT